MSFDRASKGINPVRAKDGYITALLQPTAASPLRDLFRHEVSMD